jgi:hypothetical protein
MFLIDVLEKGVSGKTAELLYIHAYLCLYLLIFQSVCAAKTLPLDFVVIN